MRHDATMPTPFFPRAQGVSHSILPILLPQVTRRTARVQLRLNPRVTSNSDGPTGRSRLKAHFETSVRCRANARVSTWALACFPPRFPLVPRLVETAFLCHCGKASRDLTQERKRLRGNFNGVSRYGTSLVAVPDGGQLRSGEGGVRLGASAVAMPIGSGPNTECRDWPDD
ncbi:hypothetical protein CGRA01v4_04750 [Colletotrichum graminicola]|nr:hypothetical protein CGRA01v4_04750 [Colletotrichum graminicola]